MTDLEYWRECISGAADECELSLSLEQLSCIVRAVALGHENYCFASAFQSKFIDPPLPRTCNIHEDCDAADGRARANGRICAEHCHDDCCVDCFGY